MLGKVKCCVVIGKLGRLNTCTTYYILMLIPNTIPNYSINPILHIVLISQIARCCFHIDLVCDLSSGESTGSVVKDDEI